MKYVIYGAGAIGGSIGARLHQQGHNVTLIARGDNLEALQRDGLHYLSPDQDFYARIPAVGSPSEADIDDDTAVFLTMKSQQCAAALSDLTAAAGRNVPVICCQNGVANEPLALRFFRRVYAMVVFLPAAHLVPGEVIHYGKNPGGLLDACRYPPAVDSTITAIAADLRGAGFLASAETAAWPLKYAKLLQNLGNALQAVCDAGRNGADIMRQLREEALACYAAAGITCASAATTKEKFSGLQMADIEGAPRTGGSSWQSMSRGTGEIETEYLNGEISYLGRCHGIATPANDLLCELATHAARERLPPGAMSIAELEQRLAARRALTSA